jgi:hypothetical protein
VPVSLELVLVLVPSLVLEQEPVLLVSPLLLVPAVLGPPGYSPSM